MTGWNEKRRNAGTGRKKWLKDWKPLALLTLSSLDEDRAPTKGGRDRLDIVSLESKVEKFQNQVRNCFMYGRVLRIIEIRGASNCVVIWRHKCTLVLIFIQSGAQGYSQPFFELC